MSVIEARFGDSHEPVEHTRMRADFRLARRRRLALLGPATAVALWALADLLAARHARGASGLVGDLLAVAWTVGGVLLPLSAGIKPHPLRAATIGAFCSGAILTGALFGAGGWHPWQILAFGAIAAAALTPRVLP